MTYYWVKLGLLQGKRQKRGRQRSWPNSIVSKACSLPKEAQIAKDKAKQQAALDTAKAAVEAGKKADQDKLAELEKLIRSQCDEQLRRDEAERQIVQEKEKAREDAVMLLGAARGATAKAEERAQRTLEETKKAYEKALANAREASEETDRKLRLERRMRQTVQEILRPTPLLLQVLYENLDDEVDTSQRCVRRCLDSLI